MPPGSHVLLTDMVGSVFTQFVGQMATQLTQELTKDPQATAQAVGEFFNSLCEEPHHTGYDACQDILDACEAGHLSHQAALTAVTVLIKDMEHRSQRPTQLVR